MASQMLLPGFRRRASKRALREVIGERLKVARAFRLLRSAEKRRRRSERGPVVDVRDLVQQRLVEAVGEDEAAAILAAAVFGGRTEFTAEIAESAEGEQRCR